MSVKSPVRLLAIDIDGTLLNSQFAIPHANLLALQRAHQAGVEVVLVTGRRHTFALPIAQQAGIPLWLISSNGAVTRSLSGELFYRDLLPRETARRLCEHMSDFRSQAVITFDCETKGALVLESLDGFHSSIAGWIAKNQEFIEYVAPIEQCLTCDPVQAMYCGGIEAMQRVQERLAAGEVARDITVLRTEYPHRDLSIVDVLNGTCSKGAAVERWARHRGIERDQVAAIGDNFNDVEMLEFAGTAFIMENACEELKRNGWRRTASNDDSGVAAAIEQVLSGGFTI
jgi:Cof subfamily protein (haloacid dehalogenase superfamily)